MKKVLIKIVLLLFSVSSSCQSNRLTSSASLKVDLINFLITKGEIKDYNVQKFKNGSYDINIMGVINGYSKSELINGIYFFSSGYTHTRTYYLIVEGEKYTVLDLSSREELDMAIKKTLDFCENQKYCSEITQDYISRILGVYYNKNKNPIRGFDINCENGIKDNIGLP